MTHNVDDDKDCCESCGEYEENCVCPDDASESTVSHKSGMNAIKLTNKVVTDGKFRNRLIAILNNIDRKQFEHVPHDDCTRQLARLLGA